jgi:hypothetical protein
MLYFKNAFDVSIQCAFYHFQSKSQAMQKIDEGEFLSGRFEVEGYRLVVKPGKLIHLIFEGKISETF